MGRSGGRSIRCSVILRHHVGTPCTVPVPRYFFRRYLSAAPTAAVLRGFATKSAPPLFHYIGLGPHTGQSMSGVSPPSL
jgi:hypothetical protein